MWSDPSLLAERSKWGRYRGVGIFDATESEDWMGMFERVYVYYPRGLETGGPEALHQLTESLRRQGVEAFLVPLPGTENRPRVKRYETYACPETPTAVDEPKSAIVMPETCMSLLLGFKRADPICWWLSVDNAQFAARKPGAPIVPTKILSGPIARAERAAKRPYRFARRRLFPYGRMHHVAQSAYAWAYLFVEFGIAAGSLSDYTVVDRLRDDQLERPYLAYNPTKGGPAMDQLQKERWDFGGFEPLPLVGLSHAHLLDALNKSAIYLDLGHHPGKDRMPREAAAMGSAVLAARRGSAAFVADMPIPLEHKLDVSDIGTSVRAAVSRVADDLARATHSQAHYRGRITAEKEIFDRQVRRLFVAGVMDDDSVNSTFDWTVDAQFHDSGVLNS